jgi:uncharacterized protein YdgA (DUF945 family)
MNKQATVAAVVLVAVLAAALLITPRVVGSMTEARVRERVAAIDASSAASAEITSFERGWFRSSARIALRFLPDTLAQIPVIDAEGNPLLGPIPVAVELAHGPVAVLDGVHLGWSRMVARLDRDAPGVTELEQTLGVPYLFEFRSKTPFIGGMVFDADAPSFTLPIDEALLTFSGATADGTFSGRRLDARAQVAGIEMASPTGTFAVSNVRFSAANELLSQYVMPGESSFSIERVTIHDSAAAGQAVFDAANLRVVSNTTLNDTGDLLDVHVDYDLDSVRVAGSELTAAKLAMALRSLDVAAIEAYSAAAGNLAGTTTNPAEIVAELAPQLDRALRAGPSITVDPLRFRFDNEPFEGRITVSTNPANLRPAGALNLDNPLLVLGLIDADGELRLSKPLALEFATLAAAQQLGVDVPLDERRYMAEAQSGLILTMLIGQGVLVEDGNDYRSAFKLTNGSVTVNGNPLLGLR